MDLSVDDYADSIMALMPGGKSLSTEDSSTLRAIALAMAEGFVRLHHSSTELLADLDPGGFSLEASEYWFNLVGDNARIVGLNTAERFQDSVLFKLTLGGTFTESMVYSRMEQLDIWTSVQFIADDQEIRMGQNAVWREMFEDIMPAHISITYDSSMA